MELTIIRHGQSFNNSIMENQDLRVPDPELTDVGHRQAQHTADFLANSANLEQIVTYKADAPERKTPARHTFTHIYVSPMHRTLQTAAPIARSLDIIPEVWTDIHEHGGIFEEQNGVARGLPGLSRNAIKRDFPEYKLPDNVTESGWWDPAAGKEDIQLCFARAMRVAQTLRAWSQQEDRVKDQIALVTHGTFIDSLIKAIIGRLPGEQYYHWHYNTALTRFDFLKNGLAIVRYINRIAHLPPELVT